MLNPKQSYSYFITTYVLGKRSPKGWYAFDCPLCDYGRQKKKMAVNFELEYVKCWECGYKENILTFVAETEGISYYEARKMIYSYPEGDVDIDISSGIVLEGQSSLIELPTGYMPLLDGIGTLGNRARKYLSSRGFDLELMDRMGFGYCNKHDEDKEKDFFGYIIVPFRTRGCLKYYIGRDYIGNYLRVKNPSVEDVGVGKAELLFNEDALELYSTAFVSEGWADAMTMGKRGVATQGWSVSTQQKSKLLCSNVKKFVFVPDKGFYKKAVFFAYDFIDIKEVYVVNLDGIEEFKANGQEKKDANDFGQARIMELYKNTEKLTASMCMDVLT